MVATGYAFHQETGEIPSQLPRSRFELIGTQGLENHGHRSTGQIGVPENRVIFWDSVWHERSFGVSGRGGFVEKIIEREVDGLAQKGEDGLGRKTGVVQ